MAKSQTDFIPDISAAIADAKKVVREWQKKIKKINERHEVFSHKDMSVSDRLVVYHFCEVLHKTQSKMVRKMNKGDKLEKTTTTTTVKPMPQLSVSIV